jgi:hypothetical protein
MKLDYTQNMPMRHWVPATFFTPHFESIKKRPMRKGIQPLFGLEIEFNPNRSRDLRFEVSEPTQKIAIIKGDGSLQEGGIEICSRPMHLKSHKVAWKPLFDKIKSKEVSPSIGKNTGLHIHFSRDYVSRHLIKGKTDLQEKDFYYRVSEFMKIHRAFFEMCAERVQNHWNKYGGNYNRCHSGALNVRQDTIEFRIFRSPKKYECCMKAIELVDAMMYFAIKTENNGGNIEFTSLMDFVAYINAHRKKYSNLNSFLYKKRKWIYNFLNVPTFQD